MFQWRASSILASEHFPPLQGGYPTCPSPRQPPPYPRVPVHFTRLPCGRKLIRGFLTGQVLLSPIHYPVYLPGFWSPTFRIPYISWLLVPGLLGFLSSRCSFNTCCPFAWFLLASYLVSVSHHDHPFPHRRNTEDIEPYLSQHPLEMTELSSLAENCWTRNRSQLAASRALLILVIQSMA